MRAIINVYFPSAIGLHPHAGGKELGKLGHQSQHHNHHYTRNFPGDGCSEVSGPQLKLLENGMPILIKP